MQKYYQNEPKFNGVYSTNDLFKIEDGTYIINLDEIGTHWISLYVNAKNVRYFDSFGVEHIPEGIRKFIGNKNVTTNIYRIQAYDSIMYGWIFLYWIHWFHAKRWKFTTVYKFIFS